MKGAPEKIVKNCSTIFIDGCEIEFSEFWKKQNQKAFAELSKIYFQLKFFRKILI